MRSRLLYLAFRLPIIIMLSLVMVTCAKVAQKPRLITAQDPKLPTIPLKSLDALLKLRNSGAAMHLQYQGKNQKISEKAKFIKDDAQFLIIKWRQTLEEPQEYRMSLTLLVALIEHAKRTVMEEKELLLIVQDVAADLRVKADHCRKSPNRGLNPFVEVKVNILRDGQSLNGYLVRCNPVRWERVRPALFPFSNPISPITRKIPPGEYKFWLEREGVEIKHRDITVGGEGQREQDVIFDL